MIGDREILPHPPPPADTVASRGLFAQFLHHHRKQAGPLLPAVRLGAVHPHAAQGNPQADPCPGHRDDIPLFRREERGQAQGLRGECFRAPLSGKSPAPPISFNAAAVAERERGGVFPESGRWSNRP
jgi:hypothetical protein